MKVILSLIFISLISYNCSPINKQHGYLYEDMVNSAEELSQFNLESTTEGDILLALGSPSIKISDINNIWIYLVSLKEQKIFENDKVLFQ